MIYSNAGNIKGVVLLVFRRDQLMQERTLSASQIQDYAQHLIGEERAPATVEKYLRDIRAFLAWTARRPVTRELGGQ